MVEDSIASIVVPIISASIAAGGLIFTGLSYRDNTKARYLQVLREFDDEISEIESSQERNNYYPMFAGRYLNVHERLAFLAQNRKIPEDLVMYYDSSFAAALGILQLPDYAEYKKELTNLICWCKMNGIKPGTAPQSYPINDSEKSKSIQIKSKAPV